MSSSRYLVFIDKPGFMQDGKTPDPNYVTAFILNQMPASIRGDFDHNDLNEMNFNQWKSRIPQLVEITPQLVDASNGNVIHGVSVLFFLYQAVFRVNPGFMLSSLTPNLQHLDYQFRSKLMPPSASVPPSGPTPPSGPPSSGPPGRQMIHQVGGRAPNTGLAGSSHPGMGGGSSHPGGMGGGSFNPGMGGSSYNPGMGGGSSNPGKPAGMYSTMGGLQQAQAQAQAQPRMPANPQGGGFLDPAKIQRLTSTSGGNARDLQNVSYTVHEDMLHYKPKKADIPPELEKYLIGSENPDVSGCSGEYEGLPSKMEERAGFLGIMEMGPTQFFDDKIDTFVNYNEASEYFDVSNIPLKPPTGSSSAPETFSAQSMKDLRRSKIAK